MAGVAVTLSGHPIDTLKVRMQAGHVRTLAESISYTFKADGVKGFYFGISSPLYTVPLVNAVVFGAYAHANYMLGGENSFYQGILAGSYAGLVNTVVVCPVELVKCKMQVQSSALGQAKYSSCWDCMVKILKEEGVKGLYRGNVATVYREIPGYAAQFASYEWAKLLIKKLMDTEETPTWGLFLAGMFGGFNCWLWSYPQDVIKTKLQIASGKQSGWDGGFYKVGKDIWKNEGPKGLFRGYSAVFLRSTVPNGVGFLAYEYSMVFLSSMFGNNIASMEL